jgi:hypothetical protein
MLLARSRNDRGYRGSQRNSAAWIGHNGEGHIRAALATRPNVPSCGIELTGVSAVSAKDVWAVSGIATEHWDGTRWRIVASPHRNPKTIAALSAVAAIAPRDVWAVGGVLYEMVAAHWNGVRWGIAPTPNTNI